ncbi:MAG: hypothetical protein C4519_03540 [Desulfobacteraceae bacterium]|nr:MAG: hypothetical protein C4519_03540 [Desulfobacteraceae bacterium]
MIKPPLERPRQAQPRLVRLVVLRAIMFAEVFITVESIGLLFLTAIYEIKPLISQYNCLRSMNGNVQPQNHPLMTRGNSI